MRIENNRLVIGDTANRVSQMCIPLTAKFRFRDMFPCARERESTYVMNTGVVSKRNRFEATLILSPLKLPVLYQYASPISPAKRFSTSLAGLPQVQ